MRLSNVSLAFAAGMLVQLILAAEPALAGDHGGTPDGDCCAVSDEPKSTLFDEHKIEEVLAPAVPPLPHPSPLDSSTAKLADAESYMDVFRVLEDDNSCSRFFGGPYRAVAAFNQFAQHLRGKSLGASTVAIRMSGSYTRYHDALTGASYRIFDDASINRDGPFFSRIMQPWMARLQIGRFPVQTRQAKALILLHELGHLVEGSDGKWLLPNDGNDPPLSDRNTRTVEARCVEQLLALKG
jgi:hypothetical protein